MNNPGEIVVMENDPGSPGSSISEMKYTVGTIFRAFQDYNRHVPHHEYIIVDRERMINKRYNTHKDMYRIKYIINPQNYVDCWLSEERLISNNDNWVVEIYNG